MARRPTARRLYSLSRANFEISSTNIPSVVTSTRSTTRRETTPPACYAPANNFAPNPSLPTTNSLDSGATNTRPYWLGCNRSSLSCGTRSRRFISTMGSLWLTAFG